MRMHLGAMTLPTILHDAICSLPFGARPEDCLPQPFWSIFLSGETISTMLATLVGALVGGAATYFAERRLHVGIEKEGLQTQLLRSLLTLVHVQSDLQSLIKIIEEAEQNAKEKEIPSEGKIQLWQVMPRFWFYPVVSQPDLETTLAVVRLRDRKLVEKTAGLLANFNALISHIATYNDRMERYEEYMKDHTYETDGRSYFKHRPGDVNQARFSANLAYLADHIASTATQLFAECREAQERLFAVSEKFFGSADFLRLPETGASVEQTDKPVEGQHP
ncbi:hypothetical protein JQ506_12950 [Shinella sp. PSBB067]|uniref:hypothetical protein n=1 Tax=Shinella sp. PSBB067 TaxID=2715959 RepID=UPI00193C5105|nr:hypothetical protein [Shinella sp. PSBB067]QRI61816.1 hypothetical protein JQ506_12950 [Shinella sp. PSBB067]